MKRVILTGLLAAAALLMACGDSETDTGDGGAGAATTSGNGGTGGTTSASGGAGGAGGTAGVGGSGGSAMCTAFGESCTGGDTCCDAAGATGECFAFGTGARCTIPCPANPADCPGGFGCNNQSPSKCKTQ